MDVRLFNKENLKHKTKEENKINKNIEKNGVAQDKNDDDLNQNDNSLTEYKPAEPSSPLTEADDLQVYDTDTPSNEESAEKSYGVHICYTDLLSVLAFFLNSGYRTLRAPRACYYVPGWCTGAPNPHQEEGPPRGAENFSPL